MKKELCGNVSLKFTAKKCSSIASIMNEWDVLQAPKINFSRERKKKNYFNCRVFQCCPTTGNCGFVTSLHTSNSHPKSFSVQVATSNTSNTKKSGNVYVIRRGKITDSTHSLAAFIKQNSSRFSTFFTHLKLPKTMLFCEGK